MEISLIRSRYKVTSVIRAEDGYAALRAVDIERGDKREYLLNVYEGASARRYAACFDSLRRCPEFREVFLSEGALIAAFEYTDAPCIDRLFYVGADIPWALRVQYARLLLHLALTVSDYPLEIACAAFYSDNLIPLRKEAGLAVNYIVQPAAANARELIYLLSDQLRKVLLRRFGSTGAEHDFLDLLESGRYDSVGKIYSRWHEIEPAVEEEYARLEAMNAAGRAIKLLSGAARRRLGRKKKGAAK
ncbi:MAG: hypothetical protein LBJ84_00415 [Oscillospiraceae bacterium]|jgi:hypothetical protein|nr:hypothetical protein [Oscillospiraceae bacterium]